jgi:CheY-like chemotaxis protein
MPIRPMARDMPSILAVEDNPENQLLLEHLLQPSFRVVIADGVDSALEAVRDDEFDVLLLDINLSEDKTGIELLQLLRGNTIECTAPAIALTAYAMPGDREEFIDAGFDSYISKPFTRKDLTEVIESTLDAHV